MAQTPEDDGDDARLELPSLSIFRRRKKGSDAGEPAEDTTQETVELGSEADEPDLEEPVRAEEPAEPTAAAETPVEAVPEAEPDPAAEADPGEETTQVLPDAAAEEDAVPEPRTDQLDEDEPADADDQPGVALTTRPERKPLVLPALDRRVAAAITGVVVGLAGVALTFIGSKGCEAVKGTSSCGGVGLFLLIAILALMVLLGAALLKAWGISDPTNSSFLAVGLVGVLAMLFFLPSIDSWYMVIVIPVLSALTYLLSWWVTHTFIESADET